MHKFDDITLIEELRNNPMMGGEGENSLQVTMNQFFNSVRAMEDTVMVPSILRDIGIGRSVDGGPKCPPSSSTASLYHFYTMLKTMKTELTRGFPDQPPSISPSSVPTTPTSPSTPTSPTSPISFTLPIQPITLSRSLSSSSLQNGSKKRSSRHNAPNALHGFHGHVTTSNSILPQVTPPHLTDSNADCDKAMIMADEFRLHMAGLLQALQQLTSTAQYITMQYKQEVGDHH